MLLHILYHFFLQILLFYSNEVKVVFWDESVIPLNMALNSAALQRLQPTIIAISSCKMILDNDNGDTRLNDAPSTRFFINHQNAEEIDLRFRYFLNKYIFTYCYSFFVF